MSVRRCTRGWVDTNLRNAVVLNWDVRLNFANDAEVDHRRPASPVVGSVRVCTSIASTGYDGPDDGPEPSP